MSTRAKLLSVCEGALGCVVSTQLLFVYGDNVVTGDAAKYYKPIPANHRQDGRGSGWG